MNLIFEFLADPANWQGPGGIPARIWEHLLYTAVTLVIASAIGIPLGLWIGHTGRGRIVVVNLATRLTLSPRVVRAVPHIVSPGNRAGPATMGCAQ